MGKLDDRFMKDLEEARKLLPQIQKHLEEPGDIPEDLDGPYDQGEIDNLFRFGTDLSRLTGRLNRLSIKLCVGMSVQEIFDSNESEEEEYEEGERDWHSETGHTAADF